MGYSLSPNMNLPVPGVGTEDGPAYATDINNCLSIIDSHNHSSGSGTQITPDGLNINDTLQINTNNIIGVNSVRFFANLLPLAGAADLGCVYRSGVDLYYNDGSGNQIQITQNGGIAGTSGSISNLTSPASAAYVSGTETFVWQSDVNKPANLDAGFIILRNNSVSSNGLTLAPPLAMASSYSITLPALPAAISLMAINASGTISTPYNIASGIPATALATGQITQVKMGSVGQQVSSSCGTFTTSSTSFVTVTNLSVNLTTTGRPVMLAVQWDGATSGALMSMDSPGVKLEFQVLRDSTPLLRTNFAVAGIGYYIALPGFIGMDVVGSGAHTYSFQIRGAGGYSMTIIGAVLVAYEL